MTTPHVSTSFTTAQVAAALGVTPQAVIKRARKNGWTHEAHRTQGGGLLWLYSSMDEQARESVGEAALRDYIAHEEPQQEDPEIKAFLDEAEERFLRKNNKAKDRAAYKQSLLFEAWCLHNDEGITLKRAFEIVAEKNHEKVHNLHNWYYGGHGRRGVRGIDPRFWLVALTDNYKGRVSYAYISPEAKAYIISDYMRREAPSFNSCFRRLIRAAKKNGWIVPSRQTVRRMVERECPRHVQEYARKGKLKCVHPVQRRRRDTFRAGEAVSGDGLKFDKLYVLCPDGEITNKITAWFWEDIRSGKILGWWWDKSENEDLIRRATYNMLERYYPRYVWIDNTRAAANKAITGQVESRHRFTKKATDPVGLFKLLGMEPHFTNPDHEMSSPGSKPVERAFGIGGLHSEMRCWPAFQGRGYSLHNPIPLEEFLEALEQVVIEHNARTGRTGGICNGRSFDEVFAEDYGKTVQRKASQELRELLLCSQEVCTVSRADASVTLNAGRGTGRHSYWSECLRPYAGERVSVLYRPDNMSSEASIFTLDGSFIGKAQWRSSVAFNDKSLGREWNRERARLNKATKAAARSAQRMAGLERQQLNAPVQSGEVPVSGTVATVLAPLEIKRREMPAVSPERRAELLQNLKRNIGEWDSEKAIPFAALA